MTPEMTFECLLVSPDPAVFCTMHRILKEFSITTNICLSTSKALDVLGERGTDLVVMDWDADSPTEFVREVSNTIHKPTILVLANENQIIPASDMVLRKPVTHEAGIKTLSTAYSRMVRDFRKHVRYAIMEGVLATDQNNRTLHLTVTNLGDGGVGLSTKENLQVGDVLSFSLPLPGIRLEISVQARVLWTRPYGAAGCEFVRIPARDLEVMLEWLRSRCRIKKPLLDFASHLEER
jgi:PilZ domain-containing protein